MPVIPPGFMQTNFTFANPGAEGEVFITPAWEISGGVTEADLEDMCTAWTLSVQTQLSSLTTFLGITAYVGNDGADPSIVEFFLDAPVAGGDGSIAAPINTAWLVRKSTGAAGRRNRGRLYLPGVTAGDLNDDATIAPAKYTAFASELDQWFTSHGIEGGMVILHNNELAPTPVTSLSLDEKVATQRGRLRD